MKLVDKDIKNMIYKPVYGGIREYPSAIPENVWLEAKKAVIKKEGLKKKNLNTNLLSEPTGSFYVPNANPQVRLMGEAMLGVT